MTPDAPRVRAKPDPSVDPVNRLQRRLSDLVRVGGPLPTDYASFTEDIRSAWASVADKESLTTAALRLQSCLPDGFLFETVHGHGLSKPMGYPGDFLMIDRIYTKDVSALEPYRRWDQYFHDHAAPSAVRGRKDYFKRLVRSTLDATGGPIQVLNIGTGPGRDLAEFLREHPDVPVRITSLDLDVRASHYARCLVGEAEDRVTFITQNAFRFTSNERFDLVWSAGLFDYLNDRLFVRLLRRATRLLAGGGSVVVGNFSDANPSRPYMELLGDWHLEHRSHQRLRDLGREAGFDPEDISIGSEPLGVNLFLHLESRVGS